MTLMKVQAIKDVYVEDQKVVTEDQIYDATAQGWVQIINDQGDTHCIATLDQFSEEWKILNPYWFNSHFRIIEEVAR
jgi:hypothetical protein